MIKQIINQKKHSHTRHKGESISLENYNLTEDTEGSDDDDARPRILRRSRRVIPRVLRCNDAPMAVIVLGAVPRRSITMVKTVILAVFKTDVTGFFAGHRRRRGRRRIRERHLAIEEEMDLKTLRAGLGVLILRSQRFERWVGFSSLSSSSR